MAHAVRKALCAGMAALLLLGMCAPAAFASGGDAVSVIFTRDKESPLERADVTAYGPDGSVLWTYPTGSFWRTELERVNDIGVHDGIYYLVEGGTVVALDVASGAVLWKNSNFGGSASCSTFGSDGVLYLCGYYGPDIFAVDTQGNVTEYVANVATDYNWPVGVQYLGSCLAVTFDMTPTGYSQTLYVDLSDHTYSETYSGYGVPAGEALTAGSVSAVSATSYLAEPQFGLYHTAGNLTDGTLENAWSEGASGQGEGESVTLQLDASYLVSGLAVNAGYQKSGTAYGNNSRPAGVRVSFSDGTGLNACLQDYDGRQVIAFPAGVRTSSVTLTIQSVYPGKVYEDTVISEIALY